MQYLVGKLSLVMGLVLLSLNAHALVIETGQLSDDTDTNVITGTNGLPYLAWNAALGLAKTILMGS